MALLSHPLISQRREAASTGGMVPGGGRGTCLGHCTLALLGTLRGWWYRQPCARAWDGPLDVF